MESKTLPDKPRGAPTGLSGDDLAKQTFDLFLAAALLLFLFPGMLLIALLIWLDSPGAVLFTQERVGKKGKIFTILKFRTMLTGTPNVSTAEMQKQKINPITRVGAVLRRTSLDELPQLLNILRGEMSFVGPRPALPSQKNLNTLRDAYGVHRLLPGITGWAQINGRDELDDETKASLDRYYLEHRSFWLDLWILLRTVVPVLTGKGNR